MQRRLGLALLSPLVLSSATPASGGETVTYTYDALGRLVVIEKSGGSNGVISTALQFDAAGNRQSVSTQGVQARVIFKESFENSVPSLVQKDDGGWLYPQQTSTSPVDGSKALRLGMIGSHVAAISTPAFVATESTITISIYVRDSGVTNASLTNWSGSATNAAHALALGVHNASTADWQMDGWPSGPFTQAPNGGSWVRYVRTIGGLTVGQTYQVTMAVDSYSGERATDVDALQVEYGSSASTF